MLDQWKPVTVSSANGLLSLLWGGLRLKIHDKHLVSTSLNRMKSLLK